MHIQTPEQRVAYLEGVISNALKAMDNAEYGSARKILKTGSAKPELPKTGVLAKGA